MPPKQESYPVNQERFDKVYERLVDETENKDTIHNRSKNQKLSDLLELMEYLTGVYDENPLDTWFSNGYDTPDAPEPQPTEAEQEHQISLLMAKTYHFEYRAKSRDWKCILCGKRIFTTMRVNEAMIGHFENHHQARES